MRVEEALVPLCKHAVHALEDIEIADKTWCRFGTFIVLSDGLVT